MNIGNKIKELRVSKNLTIKQLAESVECTPSLISQLERNKTDPSIAMLKKIADALHVNIVDFFMTDIEDSDIVTHANERVDIQLNRWDAKIQSLVKAVRNKKMQPFYTVIKKGGGSHGMYSHEGEEFGYIIQGQMDLIFNDKIFTIKEGESFYFSSHIPHDWGNSGDKDVIVLWVITPPTF
ncbi:MAG: helix-turn-helix transcriptional regulator [Syntrophorhabdaceae bacterium]|nr:helix-turn-helix transcriptional regulator [Syntrophorhabdales bacterium]MBP9561443.1 helix-turn-helix transcriptional regulator [Syntrophorhabdaceae bacterium]